MILLISAFVLLLGIVIYNTYDEQLGFGLILFSILFGFFVLGVIASVDSKTEVLSSNQYLLIKTKDETIVEIPKLHHTYSFDSAKVFNDPNPRIELTNYFNSYGMEMKAEVTVDETDSN